MITIDTEKWPAFMIDGQMIVNVPEEAVIEIQQQRDKLLSICQSILDNGIGASDWKRMRVVIAEIEASK